MKPSDPRGGLVQVIIDHENLYEGNLIEYFKAFFFLSKGCNNAYHNFRHGTHVTFLCYEGARFHQRDLNTRKIRNMMVAAIFHDFDHRGVKGDDSLNIELALSALRRFSLPLDKDHLEDIELLIRGTQYPYVLEDHELPLEGLILRDADMMQAYSKAWIQQVIFGLAEEGEASPVDVLKMQEKFLVEQKFKTPWARWLLPQPVIDLKVSEANALLDILLEAPSESPELQGAMAAARS
jgi:hypothetical protein